MATVIHVNADLYLINKKKTGKMDDGGEGQTGQHGGDWRASLTLLGESIPSSGAQTPSEE